jgi:hypothetical protein
LNLKKDLELLILVLLPFGGFSVHFDLTYLNQSLLYELEIPGRIPLFPWISHLWEGNSLLNYHSSGGFLFHVLVIPSGINRYSSNKFLVYELYLKLKQKFSFSYFRENFRFRINIWRKVAKMIANTSTSCENKSLLVLNFPLSQLINKILIIFAIFLLRKAKVFAKSEKRKLFVSTLVILHHRTTIISFFSANCHSRSN